MRYKAAVLMLAACEVASARNAALPWEDTYAWKSAEEAEEEFRERFEYFAAEIAHWGYEWQPYEVTTRDGFKLTLFRITEGPPEGFVRPELPSSSSEDE